MFNNPIRLIDTAGFADIRGKEYNEQIIKDIQELIAKIIENLHAICLLLKANDRRVYDRTNYFLLNYFHYSEKK